MLVLNVSTIVYLRCVVIVMLKRPAAAEFQDDSRRTRLYNDLAQHGTKSGLAEILMTLKKYDVLPDGVVHDDKRTLRGALGSAQRDHGAQETPYGSVVQTNKLPLDELPRWQYINPMALVYYLSSICLAFSAIMAACTEGGRALTLILYMDEICPGNALRP